MNSFVGPTEEDLDINGRLNASQLESQNGSSSSSAMTSSTSVLDLTGGEENSGDMLERIFYRTSQDDSKTTLNFVSSIFFNMFLAKIKSDFSDTLDSDNTTTVIKCVTHVQGLKCEISLDSHFNTVTVTGVGHKSWRSYYFPKASRSLFKKFVQEVDSQDSQDNESQTQLSSEMNTPIQGQSQAVNNDDYGSINGIPPLLMSTPNRTPCSLSTDQVSFRQMLSQLQNVDQNDDEISNGRKLSFMISKVCNLETVIEDLKRSIILLVEQMTKPSSFSDVVSRSLHGSESHSRSSYLNNTARSEISSQQVATENPTTSALNREDPEVSQLRAETPKQIPVIMNRFNSKKPAPVTFGKPVQRREPMTHSTNAAQRRNDEKILLLGDSIISGINTKGLVKGLHKNSKGGATLQHMIDEVSVYDMKVFSTVISSNNDCVYFRK